MLTHHSSDIIRRLESLEQRIKEFTDQFEPETFRAIAALKNLGATTSRLESSSTSTLSGSGLHQSPSSATPTSDAESHARSRGVVLEQADTMQNNHFADLPVAENAELARILAGVPDFTTSKRLVEYYLRWAALAVMMISG